jgi:hypothetical protein
MRNPGLFSSPAGRQTIAVLVCAGLVYLVSWFVLQAAVVHGSVASFNGRRASMGDCLATGLKHFVSVVLVGAIVTVAALAATLLLIVPGIIVIVMWFVAIPARVVEHASIGGSLNRSSELTRGYRWSIFGLCIVYFFAFALILLVVSALVGVGLVVTSNEDVLSDIDGPIVFVGNTISTMISSIFLSTLVAAIYYELRQIKEGIGPEALASVFD